MTQKELNTLLYTHLEDIRVCNRKVLHWNVSDGKFEMQLAGEDFYRQIVVIQEPKQ